MPMNGYNTGRDVTIQIFGNNGVTQSFTMQTRFTSKQETNTIRVKRFDGLTDILQIPDGWNGTIDYTRQNSAIDDYFADLEDAYYNGTDIQPAQITETIQEAGGVIKQYRYLGCMFKLDDAGDKTGDDVIKQRVSWIATRRIRVA